MYIPDSIRIVGYGQTAQVFSADEGHEHEEALQTARISVSYSQMNGLTIHVVYGSSFRPINEAEARTVDIFYSPNQVTFDLQHPA